MLRFVILTTFLSMINCATLEEAFYWKQIDYQWPSPEAKEAAIKSKQFIQGNNLPLGLDVHTASKRLFITVPRWKPGVASSLNYIKTDDTNKSPLLIPYPNWEANTLIYPEDDQSRNLNEQDQSPGEHDSTSFEDCDLPDESSIISTFRVRVDECDRLWVLDTGLDDIMVDQIPVAQPAIVIFDLNTDKLIRRYPLKDSHIKEDSFFANIIVDTSKDKCGNAFAYIPDLGGYGLVVYSFKNNKSWRIKHNYFYFDPLAGDYLIGGISFQMSDGIFGVALSPFDTDGYRNAYFHALSSTKEFKVSTKVLQNESYAMSNDSVHEFKLVGDRGERSQSTASFMDLKTGVLFYSQVNKDGVNCWNSAKPYSADTQGVVAVDNERLVFPNDLKTDDEDKLWILSDRMPEFLYSSVNPDLVNYRIMKTTIANAVENTACAA